MLAHATHWAFLSPRAQDTTPGRLTRPEAHRNLLWRHLDDVGARGTGALAAEGQAPEDMGAAGWALHLTSTAISDEVCFQVTPRGDGPWIAKVLDGETGKSGQTSERGLKLCSPFPLSESGDNANPHPNAA